MQFSRRSTDSLTKQTQAIAKVQRAVQWSAALLNLIVFVCLIYLVHVIRNGDLASNPRTILFVLIGGAILLAVSIVHFVIESVLTRKWLHEKEKANTDSVTGSMNRTCFEELLEDEIRRSSRYHASLSLCFLDLDSFKSYNESYGRAKGDQLLRQFSDFMKGTVRFTDSVAHYGEDEFCVLLPHTDLVRAEKFVSRALAQAQERLDHSFCAGVTNYKAGESKTHFMMRGRQALLHAKSEGKKRVRCILGDDDSQTIVNF